MDALDVAELHRRAMAWFDTNVAQIRDDQWHAPTPCTEWDVRMLVNHLVSENRWTAPLLAGRTIEEVGDRFDGDLLGDDPKRAWAEAREEAVRAVAEPGAMDRVTHLSYGDTPARAYVFELFTDLLIHGWDLARAIGANERMDPDLVEICYERARGSAEQIRASGVFGPDVTPPPGADTQTVLLAILGRVA